MGKAVVFVAVVASLVSLAWQPRAADASCMPVTEFAPLGGTTIPANATTYIVPAFESNLVVTATDGDQRLETSTFWEGEGRSRVLAVRVESEGRRSIVIRVQTTGHDGRPLELGEVSYGIDPSRTLDPYGEWQEPRPPMAVEAIARVGNEGYPACASYDHLHLWVGRRAHAYRVEWARSERAFRDGDRHTAVVPRLTELEGNVLRFGSSGCGQFVMELWKEETVFIGVAAIDENGRHDTPTDPIEIDIGAVRRLTSAELTAGTRPAASALPFIESADARRLDLADTPVCSSPRTPRGHLAIALMCGLLIGWPIGTRLGRLGRRLAG